MQRLKRGRCLWRRGDDRPRPSCGCAHERIEPYSRVARSSKRLLNHCAPAKRTVEGLRCRFCASHRTPNVWNSKPSKKARKAVRDKRHMMAQIKANLGLKPFGQAQRGQLPQQVVKMQPSAAALPERSPSRQVMVNEVQISHWRLITFTGLWPSATSATSRSRMS